ncbi:cyanophycinase [soil metagenome]
MERPRGKLIIIGGNEDKGTHKNPNFRQKKFLDFFELGILKRIINEIKGEDSYIEVITSASRIPEEVGKNYIIAFALLNCKNVRLMHIRNRKDVLNPEYQERISKADGVLFTGGNQLRLKKIFQGTAFLELLHQRYLGEEFVIAGTSAGAVAVSEYMIFGGSSSDALLKGAVKITSGLGFIKNVIIDSHFVTRGRFGRLAEAVASHQSLIGIGLGEDTGVLITEGNHMETIGSGLVLIFDGGKIVHNNIEELPEGDPVAIENLIVHVLAKGYCYVLENKQFIAQNSVVKAS